MDPDNSRSGLLAALDDADLVRLIGRRLEEAIGELYDRYAAMLLGLAQRILGSREDSEEVLQEVFVRVWESPERYDPRRSSVSTWLVLLVRSRSIDRLRNRKVVERTLAGAKAENPEPHTSSRGLENVLSTERRSRVAEELAKLPAEQRRVIDLAFFRGMTQTEIAGATGIPLGTVKTRTLLAMKKLRAALSDDLRDLL